MDRILKKIKLGTNFMAFAIFSYTLLAFFMDFFTGKEVHFYIFYFPSVVGAAWFFKKKWVYPFAFLVIGLWFTAQWEWNPARGFFLFFWNGSIRLLTFLFVAWAVLRIRQKTEALEDLSQELARSNQELEEFAFKAAHDLQTPLTTIFSYTEFLEEQTREAGQEVRELVEGILKGVRRMSLMIKELLAYSRVMKEEGTVLPVNLGEVLRDVLENLRATIDEKKAVVTVDPLPEVSISRGLALILFQNLIGNAIKYCEKDPDVRVSAVKNDKEWIFRIRDNGIGIPEADRARIFLMFEKLATRRNYPGSGIGLATCRKIVERYHGRIGVEPAAGEGSVFYFTLPLRA